MSDTFTLEIITPEHSYYVGEVEEISLTSTAGELAIKAHHLDLLANITICPLLVTALSHQYFYAISGGTLHFYHSENKAVLSVFAIESTDEIDIERALKAKENAETLLSNAQSARDSYKAEIKLKRALNRIRVKSTNSL